jgi:hypothetical protein
MPALGRCKAYEEVFAMTVNYADLNRVRVSLNSARCSFFATPKRKIDEVGLFLSYEGPPVGAVE